LRKVQLHDADDILDFKRAGEVRIAHVAAGRVVQFDLLQVELRRRKAVKRADVVIMHVGQDHVGHGIAIDADQCQRLGRAAQMPPPPRRRDFGSKSGVDDEAVLRSNRHPDEIVHRHRAIVRIAADEVVGAPRITLGIADRVELVFGKMRVHAEPVLEFPRGCLGIAPAPPQCEPVSTAYSRGEEPEP
jgi:hypothetical protein